jgi:hypothetical protein
MIVVCVAGSRLLLGSDRRVPDLERPRVGRCLSGGFDLTDLPELVEKRRERACTGGRMANPLPGMVWIQSPSETPSGCWGPKWMVVEPAGLATAAGVGQAWRPTARKRGGVIGIEQVWSS